MEQGKALSGSAPGDTSQARSATPALKQKRSSGTILVLRCEDLNANRLLIEGIEIKSM